MSKHPIIVLDGPDGTGKSTLAKAICDVLGGRYLHLTYRWKTKMFDYHTAAIFNAIRWAERQPVVIDRWWPSEIVYADAYRGGSAWPLGHRLFEKVALKHAVTYVFCLPYDKEAYLEHFNRLKGTRVEMFDSGMERVYDGFNKIYNSLVESQRQGVSRYDYTTDGKVLNEAVLRFINVSRNMRSTQWAPALDRQFMNFTGHVHKAKYIVVGDQLKPKTRREVWPFFEYGNSSKWWAEALDFAGVPEHEIITMNALMPDGSNHDYRVKSLVDAYKSGDIDYSQPDIIALGGAASNYLNSLKIDHSRLKHPQYYRRFSSNNGKYIVKETFDTLRGNNR